MNLKLAASVLLGTMIGLVMQVGRARGDDGAVCKPATRPVEEQLKAKADEFAKKAPEAAKVLENGIAAVAATDILREALKVGDKAQLFELPKMRRAKSSNSPICSRRVRWC